MFWNSSDTRLIQTTFIRQIGVRLRFCRLLAAGFGAYESLRKVLPTYRRHVPLSSVLLPSVPQQRRHMVTQRLELPTCWSRRSLKGLSDAEVAALQRLVDGQVDENLGMPMIYTIVAAAQEWLRDKVLLRQ